MKEYFERTLHQKVSVEENTELLNKLPLAFKGRYILFDIRTNNLLWLAIQPKNDTGLVMLRKDYNKIRALTTLNCALFLNNISAYIKEKLLDEGIPFVIKDKQMYLPFIGCVLSSENEREIKSVQKISMLTQMIVLTAIYERWTDVTVSEAAVKTGVSKMSVSRCFDEIEYLNINILGTRGKRRTITVPRNTYNLWNEIMPALRNPVIKKFDFPCDIKLKKKGGITALSEYTLLSDNDYPTYIITKKEIVASGIRQLKQCRKGEEVGCVVLEVGYFSDCVKENYQDPLSVVLTLTEEERQDERISIAVKEIVEEYL